MITPNDELHVSLVDPESDDLPHAPRMPECTSPMLDISSATKGICLVSLCEQVTAKRNSFIFNMLSCDLYKNNICICIELFGLHDFDIFHDGRPNDQLKWA